MSSLYGKNEIIANTIEPSVVSQLERTRPDPDQQILTGFAMRLRSAQNSRGKRNLAVQRVIWAGTLVAVMAAVGVGTFSEKNIDAPSDTSVGQVRSNSANAPPDTESPPIEWTEADSVYGYGIGGQEMFLALSQENGDIEVAYLMDGF